MKIKSILLLSLFAFLQAHTCIGSSTTTTTSSSSESATVLYRNQEQKLFFPADMPTTSYAEKAIDQIYGSSGLKLSETEINKIKKTYFYLEFLVKIDKANNDATYEDYKNDFAEFLLDTPHQKPHSPTTSLLKTNGWQKIPVTHEDVLKSEAWQNFINSQISDCYVNDYVTLEIIHQVEDQIFPYIPNIEVAYYNYDFTRLRNLAETTRIKAVMQADLKKRYLKESTDWASVDHTTLGTDVVAFKKGDFYQSTHNLNAWATITKGDDNKLSGTPTNKTLTTPLREQVWAYFMLINVQGNITGMMTAENLNSVLSHASSNQLQPNFFYYQPSDFVYLYDFLSLKENFDSDHTASDATADSHQKKSVVKPETLRNSEHMASNQRPNTPGSVDVQALIKPKSSPSKSTEAVQVQALGQPKKQNDDVVVQNIFKDIGHGLESAGKSALDTAEEAGKDVGHELVAAGKAGLDGIESAGKFLLHGAEAAGEGAAGFGASMVGDVIYSVTGDDSVRNWGHEENKKAIADLKQAGDDLDKAVDDFATTIEDGLIAPIATVTGSLVGFILQDKKIGQDTTGIINNVADSLVNIAATIVTSEVDIVDDVAVQAFTLTEKFSEVVTDAAMAAAGVVVAGATGGQDTGMMDRSGSELSEDGKALVHDTVKAITETFTCLLHAVKAVMMSVVQCLAAITNSITTIFIDTVREVTFIGASLTALVVNAAGGHMNADQIRDHVTNVLEEHRRTINMVVGVTLAVAMTVAITVCTAGAGAPEAVAMDTALIGGETAGETAATVTAETAATAGTEGATTTAASTATDVGVDAGTVSGVGQEAATGTVSGTSSGTTSSTTTVATTTGDTTTTVGDSATTVADDSSSTIGDSTTPEETGGGDESATDEGDGEEDGNDDEDENGEKGKKAKWTTANSVGQLLNVAFGAFNVIAGSNQDAAAIDKENKSEEALRNLWKFIENTKASLTQNQKLYLEEMDKKHHAAIGNQALGLDYYMNFLNAATDNFEEQISLALGQVYTSMLTPNSNGMRAANIGSSWGINTPFVYLYPSQGFLSTTLGREDFPFAQEIAQAPLVAQEQSSSTTSVGASTNVPLKLWFNQRAVTTVNKAATDKLEVEIKFRVIYSLESAFHVGLYLGGTYHDYLSASYLNELKSKGSIDLDTAHLAKMFVIHRENKTAPTKIGIYENEGKGWVVDDSLPASTFAKAEVYHMKATLDGTSLAVSFWPESSPSSKWTSTKTVTTTDQRTFGLIFSGAAIEWDVISPKITTSANTKARPAIGNQSEADREKASQAKWKSLMNPTFGSFKLSAVSKGNILRGQYLYTTTSTGLKDSSGKAINDYILFAQAASSDVSDIGISPISSTTPNVAISVITGNVYDGSGNVLSHKKDVWTTYNKAHGPFASQLSTEITSAQKEITQQQMSTKVGSFDLTAVSQSMIENSQYVYTCSSTITEKTSAGKAITDYVIMAKILNNSLGTAVGMPPTQNNTGMVSLVTGNVYDATSTKPIDSGYSELIPYEAQYGNIPSSVMTKINASKTAYLAALKASEKKSEQSTTEKSTSQPKTISLGSSGLSLSNISSQSSPDTGGLQLGLSSAAPGLSLSTDDSFSLRQNDAANGSSLQLGGLSGGGLSLSSSSSNSTSGLSLGGELNQGLSLDSSSLSLGT